MTCWQNSRCCSRFGHDLQSLCKFILAEMMMIIILPRNTPWQFSGLFFSLCTYTSQVYEYHCTYYIRIFFSETISRDKQAHGYRHRQRTKRSSQSLQLRSFFLLIMRFNKKKNHYETMTYMKIYKARQISIHRVSVN